MLAVQPTVELAKRFSQQRIDPLIEESPVLRDRVAPARSRDAGNTLLSKEFPGGILVMTGANSAVGLRSMPVRYLFLDEVDAYPASADDEGAPVDIAIQRTGTATFRGRRKIYMVSTPTLKGYSHIEAAFTEADQRHFHVPCLACGVMAPITWARIRWPEGRRADAYLVCEACGGIHHENDKAHLMETGEWCATRGALLRRHAIAAPPEVKRLTSSWPCRQCSRSARRSWRRRRRRAATGCARCANR